MRIHFKNHLQIRFMKISNGRINTCFEICTAKKGQSDVHCFVKYSQIDGKSPGWKGGLWLLIQREKVHCSSLKFFLWQVYNDLTCTENIWGEMDGARSYEQMSCPLIHEYRNVESSIDPYLTRCDISLTKLAHTVIICEESNLNMYIMVPQNRK